MPPQIQQRFGGAPNNLASHYQQYPTHSQGHAANLPPPSLGSNPSFMNANSVSNAFAVNGNSLGMTGGFGTSGIGMSGGILASHAAQISFAGAPVQQQSHNSLGSPSRNMVNKGRIRDVWKSNLAEEMAIVRQVVEKHPYIAMDTEFPGLVARPMGAFSGKSDYHYQCLRCNVDMLKVLQIGITLFTEEGETLPGTLADPQIPGSRNHGGGYVQLPCTWQFNFKFSLEEEMYNETSIESLRQAGLNFANMERDGIDPFDFGALLISSGLVCDEDVRWISFHGGYDFGYLTKLMICQALPPDERSFDMLMRKFFPSIYDIKYLMKHAVREQQRGAQMTPGDQSADVLAKFETKSGLESLAESFKIKRQGAAHTAGSDSLLTGKVFFKMRERIFNGEISNDHLGKVWGLGLPEHNNAAQHSTPQHYNPQLQENTTPNQNGNTYGTPSTPSNNNVGLSSGTPVHVNQAPGPLTPGGGGGVFGNFQFNNR